jgi:hypothetical protein
MVDILSEVENRPEQERPCAEILEYLSGLSCDGGQILAAGRVREVSKLLVRKTESLG